MELYTVVMKLVKETKGALRYEEVTPINEDAAKIGTLYIRKDGVKGEAPKSITVTVKSV